MTERSARQLPIGHLLPRPLPRRLLEIDGFAGAHLDAVNATYRRSLAGAGPNPVKTSKSSVPDLLQIALADVMQLPAQANTRTIAKSTDRAMRILSQSLPVLQSIDQLVPRPPTSPYRFLACPAPRQFRQCTRPWPLVPSLTRPGLHPEIAVLGLRRPNTKQSL